MARGIETAAFGAIMGVGTAGVAATRGSRADADARRRASETANGNGPRGWDPDGTFVCGGLAFNFTTREVFIRRLKHTIPVDQVTNVTYADAVVVVEFAGLEAKPHTEDVGTTYYAKTVIACFDALMRGEILRPEAGAKRLRGWEARERAWLADSFATGTVALFLAYLLTASAGSLVFALFAALACAVWKRRRPLPRNLSPDWTVA